MDSSSRSCWASTISTYFVAIVSFFRSCLLSFGFWWKVFRIQPRAFWLKPFYFWPDPKGFTWKAKSMWIGTGAWDDTNITNNDGWRFTRSRGQIQKDTYRTSPISRLNTFLRPSQTSEMKSIPHSFCVMRYIFRHLLPFCTALLLILL